MDSATRYSLLSQAKHLAKSKTTAGYGGFIPKIKAENFIGRNHSELSKDAFRQIGGGSPEMISKTG